MYKVSIVLATAGLLLMAWSFLPAQSTGHASGVVATRSVQIESVAATSTVQITSMERGKALFAAKGCATCHVNRRAIEPIHECCEGTGPDLTNYTNQPEYLRQLLRNPSAVKPQTEMPNLELSDAEIEDLIAFLNQPR